MVTGDDSASALSSAGSQRTSSGDGAELAASAAPAAPVAALPRDLALPASPRAPAQAQAQRPALPSSTAMPMPTPLRVSGLVLRAAPSSLVGSGSGSGSGGLSARPALPGLGLHSLRALDKGAARGPRSPQLAGPPSARAAARSPELPEGGSSAPRSEV